MTFSSLLVQSIWNIAVLIGTLGIDWAEAIFLGLYHYFLWEIAPQHCSHRLHLLLSSCTTTSQKFQCPHIELWAELLWIVFEGHWLLAIWNEAARLCGARCRNRGLVDHKWTTFSFDSILQSLRHHDCTFFRSHSAWVNNLSTWIYMLSIP